MNLNIWIYEKISYHLGVFIVIERIIHVSYISSFHFILLFQHKIIFK